MSRTRYINVDWVVTNESKRKMSHLRKTSKYLNSLELSQRSTRVTQIMLKILVIGDYGVGKTAIVRRYTEGKFSSNYKITIGAEFSLKNYLWDNCTHMNIQLWDIAGHERFGYMTRVYYKYASAAAIVFDVSRVQTFASIQKWLVDLRDKVMLSDGTMIPVVILANKSDISGSTIPKEMLDKYCREDQVIGWFSTSAKENINIDEAMGQLILEAMNNQLIKDNTREKESIELHAEERKIKTRWNRRCCQ